jgi:hypothetical protein
MSNIGAVHGMFDPGVKSLFRERVLTAVRNFPRWFNYIITFRL